MLMMFRRMLTYFTLAACLMVGTFAVRVLQTEEAELTIDLAVINNLASVKLANTSAEKIQVEEVKFAQMNFEQPRKFAVVQRVASTPVTKPVVKVERVSPYELPFNETITLEKISYKGSLLNNLVSLYTDFQFKTELVAENTHAVSDEVKVSQSKSDEIDAEPVFLEYETEKSDSAPAAANVADSTVVAPSEDLKEASMDIVPDEKMKNEKPVAVTEEVGLEDLVAFDYSKANEDIKTQTTSTATPVVMAGGPAQATQSHQAIKSWEVLPEAKPARAQAQTPVTTQQDEKASGGEGFVGKTKNQDDYSAGLKSVKNSLKVPKINFPKLKSSQTVVQVIGTNLKGNEVLKGFEVRFHDDYSEIQEDYNNGEAVLEHKLAQDKMNRTIRVLKRGFAATNTDLLVEKASASNAIPLIEENTFHEIMADYEAKGPAGAVLVELDDETEYAQLDVPFAKVILLDGDLRETTANDHRYQLFVGVRAGNSMVTYKRMDKEIVTKIIHVHDGEVTFENNFFEELGIKKVQLFEEDLLSREKNPLVISSEQVKVFALDRFSKKINDHTYKLNFHKGSLGGRTYLELLHQAEPIFVGMRNNSKINIPSENFMRHILSRLDNSSLGNRCLIQVNLSKKAMAVEVGAQSVEESLMTSVQMLDADGKFYDSVSGKSRKIIIMGESQANSKHSQDGRINVKIDYQDGSVEYLNSYCSPNTYMVEQL